ncbi:Rieske 2Fe-2S domain-containing protein [Hansschlegelia beijingensis]|uniref:Toluene monooxygenase system ferredoxin subunit n=1 Tax=Hansschlegelia beijingensis TaxID=1133344 RepID=A0A7W6D3U9_9HYPH|nr:Rieske 2Fe-2S domain-containing protein [Hansschlegelia beijingensis]MBB3971669.1 toluene monooxygenase system ferredoxin subunit [Hansschlegelia beijingensis]
MSWTYLCDAAEVAPNSLKLVDANDIRIVVANYGSGFRAIPPICPHMEEPLEESGVIANCVLTCTKHLWAWNLISLDMLGETEKPLKTYEVKEEDGKLLAYITEELTYDFEEEDDMDDDFFSKS